MKEGWNKVMMNLHLGNGDRLHPWRDIRRARAQVPKGAGTATRKAIFATALQQADSLWSASESVEPLARPILQYYSLFQIGLALAAGSNLSEGEWRPKQNHGLTVHIEKTSSTGVLDLNNVIIKASGEGMAQALARVLDSPLLDGQTTLASAIAALPHQKMFKPLQTAETFPVFLRYYDAVVDPFTLAATPQPRVIDLRPTPGWLPRRSDSTTTDGTRFSSVGPTWAEVQRWLFGFPDLKELEAPDEIQTVWTMLEEDGASVLRLIYAQDRDPLQGLLTRASVYGNNEIVALQPLGENVRTQHPMLTWFMVTHALSILSRYHSGRWQRVLDLDRNPGAASLREFVEDGVVDCIFIAGRTISMISLLADYRYNEPQGEKR